jgi:hypothetical protein
VLGTMALGNTKCYQWYKRGDVVERSETTAKHLELEYKKITIYGKYIKI